MRNELIAAASAALGGLIVGALEEWRARRRAAAADADHDARARALVDAVLRADDNDDTR